MKVSLHPIQHRGRYPLRHPAATLLLCVTAGCAATGATESRAARQAPEPAMQLGNFSVSLATVDLAASRSFYEALGFRMIGGDPAQHWVILRSGHATIGLFQGMFERNILTFNPGWDADGHPLAEFDDVRDIQRALASRGIPLTATADASSTGPAHIMLVDPDGNPILIDQHVPKPPK